MDLDKRIYIECAVYNSLSIKALQADLITKYGYFEATSPDLLHLTVFHIGKPRDLYNEINAHSKIAFQEFLSRLEKFLENINKKVIVDAPDLKEVPHIVGLDVFGNNTHGVLALKIDAPKAVLAAASTTLDLCYNFLRDCGIEDVQKFIQQSPNLKFNLDYNPHVSIGYSETGFPKVDVDLSKVNFTLGPVKFSGDACFRKDPACDL